MSGIFKPKIFNWQINLFIVKEYLRWLKTPGLPKPIIKATRKRYEGVDMTDKTIKSITDDLNNRMESHINSMCATDDEVSIAYLLCKLNTCEELLKHTTDVIEYLTSSNIEKDGQVAAIEKWTNQYFNNQPVTFNET